MTLFSSAQVKPSTAIVIARDGDKVCVVASATVPGRCYRTAKALGVAFSNDVEYVYPHVEAYHRALAQSDRLPREVTKLEAIGGAILLERPAVAMVAKQLSGLTVRNLAFDLSGPVPLKEFPFVLTIDWKNRRGDVGTVNVVGSLRIVEDIFSLNLSRPGEFRDRLVANTTVLAYDGPRVPLKTESGTELTVEDTIKSVVVPFLGGKFVSIGRIGFNQMADQMQDSLQQALDRAVDEMGPKKPL